jgi:16S rRNA (guanine527-N7)-methyltransferase
VEALVAVLTEARDLGFLGPGPVEEHLDHARAYRPALSGAPAGVAFDLGAGGGVPGLVLATMLPDRRWVLVDAMGKRTAFLERAVASLGLANVEVRTVRAEELGRAPASRGTGAIVVARSFGAPPVLAECAAPLLAVGGLLVVSEPPGGDAGRWPIDGLELLGLAPLTPIPGPPALFRATQVAPCPDRYPRRVGVPAKRPLW